MDIKAEIVKDEKKVETAIVSKSKFTWKHVVGVCCIIAIGAMSLFSDCGDLTSSEVDGGARIEVVDAAQSSSPTIMDIISLMPSETLTDSSAVVNDDMGAKK